MNWLWQESSKRIKAMCWYLNYRKTIELLEFHLWIWPLLHICVQVLHNASHVQGLLHLDSPLWPLGNLQAARLRCDFSGMFITTRACHVHHTGISSASAPAACKHTSAYPACALGGCVEKKCVPVLNSCAAFLRRTCWGRSTGKRRSRVAQVELGASPVAQKDRRQGLGLITEI